MKNNYITSTGNCLRGHGLTLTIRLITKRICNLLFVLYCLASFYLLVFDTTFIAEIRLFDNHYVAVVVCFSCVLIGFTFLLLSQWQKFRYKISVFSVIENVRIRKFSTESVIKYVVLCFVVKFIKCAYFLFFALPSIILTSVVIYFLRNGIVPSILVILAVCDAVLLFNGIINSFYMIQKFSMVDYCFNEYEDKSVIEIMKISSHIMDGHCRKLAKYKLSHSIFKLLGIFIPTLTVKETASEFLLQTDKINPYVHHVTHTEKPVVFYFGNATAG